MVLVIVGGCLASFRAVILMTDGSFLLPGAVASFSWWCWRDVGVAASRSSCRPPPPKHLSFTVVSELHHLSFTYGTSYLLFRRFIYRSLIEHLSITDWTLIGHFWLFNRPLINHSSCPTRWVANFSTRTFSFSYAHVLPFYFILLLACSVVAWGLYLKGCTGVL